MVPWRWGYREYNFEVTVNQIIKMCCPLMIKIILIVSTIFSRSNRTLVDREMATDVGSAYDFDVTYNHTYKYTYKCRKLSSLYFFQIFA